MYLLSFSLRLLLTLLSISDNWTNNTLQDSDKYAAHQVAEKVYLHIDRISYTSGDDIWFKAYVIDPSTNSLSLNTNKLYVELISPGSKIIQRRTVRIENGTGRGDFQLNDSIPSGRLRIRAYTNYMRNFDEQFFFIKEITIVSPYDEVQGLNRTINKIDNKIDITFFPEGGSLIDNVTSRIAFKAVNALGKGCDVAVKLFTPSGEHIATFNSTHKGMGYFNLQPGPDNTYYTVVQSSDSTETRAALPESFHTGVVIRTLVNKDKKLILTVITNEATLPLLKDIDLSINLSSRNLINKLSKIRINSLENNFLIPLDSIPDGIFRVTLSGAEGLPLCERLIYLQKKGDVKLNISPDKKVYKPREKLTAQISLSGDSTFTGAGEFSFSAAEERFTENFSPWPTSIASWFLLESDVRGTIEDPSWYFDPDNKNRLLDLDLLLMTHGWRDFRWKYDSLSAFNHETGFLLSGKVKRIVNNNPVEGAKINLGLFSADSREFLSTKTDKEGSYKFENLFFNGITEATLSSTDKSENAQGKISVDPVKYELPVIEKIRPDTLELSLNIKDYSSLRQEAIIKLNNLKKYKLSDTLMVGEVFITAIRAETAQEIKVKESRRVYSVPDKEIKVNIAEENFVGDVFSFISGRIGGVRVLRGQDPCSIYFPDDADVFIRGQFIVEKKRCPDGRTITLKRGALVLLDGYEVDPANLSSVLTLPMNIIDRIDVLNASPLYGVRGANGVINIITLTGIRRAPEKPSPNYVYTIVNGYDIPRIFYSPNYDNKTEQTFNPDYRSTIFWEPDIKVEKSKSVKLEYFNADNPTKISIAVEGVTREGIPVTGRTNYEVK
jgi:hypothetical protein